MHDLTHVLFVVNKYCMYEYRTLYMSKAFLGNL